MSLLSNTGTVVSGLCPTKALPRQAQNRDILELRGPKQTPRLGPKCPWGWDLSAPGLEPGIPGGISPEGQARDPCGGLSLPLTSASLPPASQPRNLAVGLIRIISGSRNPGLNHSCRALCSEAAHRLGAQGRGRLRLTVTTQRGPSPPPALSSQSPAFRDSVQTQVWLLWPLCCIH